MSVKMYASKQALHHHNVLTAEATVVAKFLNSGEDVFPSSSVKFCVILNSNTTFGFAGGGAGVVVGAAHDAQWVETVSCSCNELV